MRINHIIKTMLFFWLILCSAHAFADLPYNPLQFSLRTAQESYWEGDKIEFIMTIKNNDVAKTYPIVLPGGQNSGNKIIYLRVFDPAENMFVLRAEESRDINMIIKHIGINEVVQLKPGATIEVPFFWNDMEHYFYNTESHHAFHKPLFAGNYYFQAFYNPFQNIIGDTLYHQMNYTEDEQSRTKLNFMGPGMTLPCKVFIKKNKPGAISIEGINYICKDYSGSGYSFYYYHKGHEGGNNQIHIANTKVGESFVNLDWSLGSDSSIEWLQRDLNGNIIKYGLSNEKRCPKEYFAREFDGKNLKQPVVKTDTSYNNDTLTRLIFNQDGAVIFRDLYVLSNKTHTLLSYTYKNQVLVKTRKKTEKFQVPCKISHIELGLKEE